MFTLLLDDIWDYEKGSVCDFNLILLFLPNSIAFIDYLTNLRRFSSISKDYKEFQSMRWDFQGF